MVLVSAYTFPHIGRIHRSPWRGVRIPTTFPAPSCSSPPTRRPSLGAEQQHGCCCAASLSTMAGAMSRSGRQVLRGGCPCRCCNPGLCYQASPAFTMLSDCGSMHSSVETRPLILRSDHDIYRTNILGFKDTVNYLPSSKSIELSPREASGLIRPLLSRFRTH
jgi:hypothetical protein